MRVIDEAVMLLEGAKVIRTRGSAIALRQPTDVHWLTGRWWWRLRFTAALCALAAVGVVDLFTAGPQRWASAAITALAALTIVDALAVKFAARLRPKPPPANPQASLDFPGGEGGGPAPPHVGPRTGGGSS